ncbi:MAG: urea ABC transporter permease subunit UrtB [Alphaproteobacteria bacterium]|nr:urea ABC transporter permease subunit UrtB [Alphaproteobacteria bacterium]
MIVMFRFLACLWFLLAAPAFADPLADLIPKLGRGGFADKAEVAAELGALGDGRAIAALRALADGKLVTRADGSVAIAEPAGEGVKLAHPLTGADLGTSAADTVERIRINNRLRAAIAAALGALQIFSPNPEERLAAAREAAKAPTPELALALDKALAAETVPAVRAALRSAQAAVQLSVGTIEQRIRAVEALSAATDPQVRNLLRQVAQAAEAPAELRAAAETALRSIERRLQLAGLAEILFQGVSLGSVLLLAAIGLAITFGVMGVINMAHGEMIMIGAYTAFVVQEIFRAYLPPDAVDLYLPAAVPAAFLAAALVGIALERGVIRFLYGRALETLLATWGISLMLQQAVRSVFGAPNKEVANPAWMTGGFEPVGGFFVAYNRLAIVVFCFLVLGAIALILRRTAFGLHVRAVTQNRDMAKAMGIPVARIDALTFGLGSGIAGMAGVALSQIGNVSPNLGQIYIVDSFMVVVFGGVGSLLGTLAGAMTLGVINKLLEPVAGAVLGKIVVLAAIIVFIQRRPRGLFAPRGRAAEG